MLKLVSVTKTYKMGDNIFNALKDINLNVDEGDYIAIMGPSGSGKSTLMHILGLLDIPTSGSYTINGKEVSGLSEDQLSDLRRETIGFIFQQFNLLPRMSALENVTVPLLYSKIPNGIDYGSELLKRTGIGGRATHRPNELSGGQQQRVAIARSLINRPQIIFADEPTGNLDSTSEKEILAILKELNEQGITVIIVTHEEEVGQQAKRLIRMRDGVIVSDERQAPLPQKQKTAEKIPHQKSNFLKDVYEYLKLGFKTLAANKVRTALSVLGILIGVAAVIAMLAIGRGAQKQIESQLSSLGSNLLVLRPGALRVGGVMQEAGATTRLSFEDSQYIKDQIPGVKNSSATVNGRGQVTYQNKNWSTQIVGASPSYEQIRASVPELGRFFTDADNLKRARVAVIGLTVVRELFGNKNPIGEMIKVNRINFQVIGILPEKGANGFRDQDDMIVMPVYTAMHRLLGKEYVDSIDLEMADAKSMENAEDKILALMNQRHRVPPAQKDGAFEIRNMADIQAAVQQSSQTMSLLLSSIAAISLVVGGIGIMNIMLVSVTERTREIGLRKAIGAKRWDILAQFLSESVVVSIVGGISGIILGWIITLVIGRFSGWSTSISLTSVLLSFFFSGSIGIIFGIYPARKASLLHPIDALRHE
jgi:macrolide transport system ATP-binding/permease protein